MGVCCLCGGAKLAAGADLPASAPGSSSSPTGGKEGEGGRGREGGGDGEAWVLVPAELKTLPAKLLPRFTDLRQGGGKAADVVKITPEEGRWRNTSIR